MAAGDPVNSTHVDASHPCYEIDTVSYTMISTPSILCVLYYVLFSSVSAVMVCGNLLVIVSILYFKQLHTPTNSLILSLAVADLLVGLLVFPLNMEFSTSRCFYISDVLCKVRNSLDVTLTTASILNLCCISIDRYYAVCQPLTYRAKINVHVVVVMIVVTWSVSVLVTVRFEIAGGTFGKCQESCFLQTMLVKILGPFCAFYLPVMVMVCIYLKIFLVAQKQARSIQNTKTRATGRKGEGKATKTLAIVMGVFLLCLLPFFLYLTSDMLGNTSVPAEVYETLVWLALFNSLLNPFIYAFFYSWFRSAFRLILTGKILQGDFSNTKLL